MIAKKSPVEPDAIRRCKAARSTSLDCSKVDSAARGTLAGTASPPFFIEHAEFRRMLGGVSKTTGYAIIGRHQVKLVKIGSRSMIPYSEAERVRDELMDAADFRTPAKAGRLLAASSVAARKAGKAGP